MDEQSSLGSREGAKEDLHQIGGFKVADNAADDSEITAPKLVDRWRRTQRRIREKP